MPTATLMRKHKYDSKTYLLQTVFKKGYMQQRAVLLEDKNVCNLTKYYG